MTFATRTLAVAATLTLIAAGAQAQDTGRFSLELRSGVSIPAEDVGTQALESHSAFDLTANFQVMPHLALFVGRNQVHFGLEQNIGSYEEIEDCGYTLGARFFAPSLGPITPWVRAGATYSQVEFESGGDNDDEIDSDYGFGWEAGAGLAVALGDRWALLPGVRYRATSPEMDDFGGEADLKYFAVDLGVSITFGGRSMAAAGHK